MTHLNTSNTCYGQKKGREWNLLKFGNWIAITNWQFDSRSLKAKNRPKFLACRWRATYCWKDFDEGYNFALDFISIRGLKTKLWAPKSWKSQLWEFRDSHLGVPKQNDIWVLDPWPCTKYIIRGKVMASLKSGSWWVLWVRVCPWLVCAPKCCNYALPTCCLVCAGPRE
jgi:hypothetical protein